MTQCTVLSITLYILPPLYTQHHTVPPCPRVTILSHKPSHRFPASHPHPVTSNISSPSPPGVGVGQQVTEQVHVHLYEGQLVLCHDLHQGGVLLGPAELLSLVPGMLSNAIVEEETSQTYTMTRLPELWAVTSPITSTITSIITSVINSTITLYREVLG